MNRVWLEVPVVAVCCVCALRVLLGDSLVHTTTVVVSDQRQLMKQGDERQGEGEVQRVIRQALGSVPRTWEWHDVATHVVEQVMSNGLLDETAPPSDSEITIVTCLFDHASHTPNAPSLLGHSYESDVEWFLMSVGSFTQPKVVFVDPPSLERLSPVLDEDTTRFVVLTLQDLEKNLGNAYEDILRIQGQRQWYSQAGWLKHSPQATVPTFNLVGFSKLFMLRQVARANPFGTAGFLWVDGRHDCLQGNSGFSRDPFTNSHLDRFVATYFHYDVMGEVHGFPRGPFLHLTGAPADSVSFKIPKGNFFGGKLAHIEVVTVLFDLLMRASLSRPDNAMGVDESLLAILVYRFPRLFHLFSNDDSCRETVSYDHSCEDFANPAAGCAFFDWIKTGGRKPSRRVQTRRPPAP